MSGRKRILKRYSEAFKKEVVREYIEGTSIAELRRKYDIGGDHTIQNWVKKYAGADALRYEYISIQKPAEREVVKEKEKEIERLKKVISDLSIKNVLLEEELKFYKEEILIRKNKKKRFELSKKQQKGQK